MESTADNRNENELTGFISTDDEHIVKRPSGVGIRHQFAVIACFVCFNISALRANLGLTMVTMVNISANEFTHGNLSGCYTTRNTSYASKLQEGGYNWDETTQGILLASFFYGYMVTQIPGGRMAEVFGPKKVMGLGIFVTSLCTLVTPVSANLHVGALLAVRVLLGLSQGVALPCIHYMIGKWIPRSEMTTISVFIYGGLQVGLVVSMAISGVLCSSEFLGGWPSVYYVFGSIGFISTVLWWIFVYDSPAVHPKISEKERKYILSSTGLKKNINIPYKSIITSMAVWAICIGHLSHAWGYYTIMTCFPMYMNRIQNIDVTQSGVLMSAIFIMCWFVSMLSGIISDNIRRKEYLSTSNTRKLFNSLGTFIGALCLILIKLSGCNHEAVIALVVLSTAFVTFCDSGYNVNHIDIAPNFAGTLYGVSNTLATLSGIVSPYLVGVLTQNNQTMEQWQTVFYISAGIYSFGGFFFLMFSKGVLQKWNGNNISIVVNLQTTSNVLKEAI